MVRKHRRKNESNEFNSDASGIKKYKISSNVENKSKRFIFLPTINIKISKSIKSQIIKIVAITVSVASCFALFFGMKNANQNKLKQYHQSIIGKTYGDNKEITFRIGQNVERSVIEIIDEDTLYFKSGIFSTSFDQKSNVNSFIVTGTTIYTEVDVSKPVSYKYALSISITGKVTISFNGKVYPVNIEDGNIQGIDMY